MKKLYAILLGLALTLGMASIASAVDLKVTGEFEFTGVFDGGWDGLDYDAANLYIDLKGPMGDNATGELKVGWCELHDLVFVNLAKFQYNITDSFYAGAIAQERHDGNMYRFFYSAVNGGEGFYEAFEDEFQEWDGSAYVYGRYIFFDEFVNLFAGFKFDGGSIDVYTDLYPGDASWYVKGSYATDALTVTAWFAHEYQYLVTSWDNTTFIGKVKYAFSDQFNMTGGVASINSNVYLGIWAQYALEDVVTLDAYLEYDASPFYNNDYWFMATLTLLGDFQPYFEWLEKDGISIGFDYYMGASDFWGEYYFDSGEFDLGIDLVF